MPQKRVWQNNKKGIAKHWWLMPIIPILRRQRSRGLEFEASLGK
jgi:hypothetical protein